MKKPEVSKYYMEKVHPYIPEAYDQLVQGRITRREFLRLSTLLGMSAGTAAIASACGAPATEAPAPVATGRMEEGPAMSEKRGGELQIVEFTKASDHPARYSWLFDANQTRLVHEYLTETDKDNITHPFLLESWTANDDLTVWDLNVRQGVNWTDGSPLTAEHVKFNFEEWLNPDTGSSVLGLWQGFLEPANVEVVSDQVLRLNLNAPLLSVPENMFHYPSQIIHPSFDGDVTSGNNLSTGAHVIEEYIVGERIRTVARWTQGDEGYWQKGEDGLPLTYFEAINWIDSGEGGSSKATLLQTGQTDIANLNATDFLTLRDDPNFNVVSITTSQTQVLRFRVDLEPWSDNRVRLAVKKLQDREKMLENTYFGEGVIGNDTHISPVHPAYSPMAYIPYDPEGAKALLAEAGQEGLEFEVSVGTGWDWIVSIAETLAEDAKAAGVNVTLDTMPNSAYWDLWKETPVGISWWAHRPLAVMVLSLAYIGDDEGNPVAWNETRWMDEKFSELLKKAQGTLDLEARRAIYADLQRIQSERGSIGIAYFYNVWLTHQQYVVGALPHPTDYNLWHQVWIDKSKQT